MNKTKIEWVKNPDDTQGYTWNPITGCLNGCEYCWAYKLANGRLRERYLDNDNISYEPLADTDGKVDLAGELYSTAINDPFYPRLWWGRLGELPCFIKQPDTKPRGIFVCDMSDLFGIGIPETWTLAVIDRIRAYSWHRFYLLTKQPQNLIKFSPFPPNCYVGVTATNREMYLKATGADGLDGIGAKVKYISLEPLLEAIHPSEYRLRGINQVIIGACTGTKSDLIELNKRYPDLTLMPYGHQWTLQPQIEWVEMILVACHNADIAVFMKGNLQPLLDNSVGWAGWKLRQEIPK